MNNDQKEKMLKHYSEINMTNRIYKNMKASRNAARGISRKRATLKNLASKIKRQNGGKTRKLI